MPANSTTIIRAWTAEGYHRDILVIDSDQVRLHDNPIKPPGASKLLAAGGTGPSMVIDPKDFPEMVEFQVIVVEYRR